jgi:serine/threonine protein kinase
VLELRELLAQSASTQLLRADAARVGVVVTIVLGGVPGVLKLPNPAAGSGGLSGVSFDERVDALRHEIRVLAACAEAPNIVRIRRVPSRGSVPYFVADQLGDSLDDELGDREFTLRELAEVVRDVARALVWMHARDLVHNDLGPHNILRSRAGWTLIDPAPPNMFCEPYTTPRVRGFPRDVLALGRTIIALAVGARNDVAWADAEGTELADDDDLGELVRSMLDHDHDLPNAEEVYARANAFISANAGG